MNLEATTTGRQGATSAGIGLLVVCLVIGAILGSYAGGTDVGDSMVDMTVITAGDGSFNWLLFTIFAAAGLVSLAVGVAAGAVSATMHNLAVIEQARDRA